MGLVLPNPVAMEKEKNQNERESADYEFVDAVGAPWPFVCAAPFVFLRRHRCQHLRATNPFALAIGRRLWVGWLETQFLVGPLSSPRRVLGSQPCENHRCNDGMKTHLPTTKHGKNRLACVHAKGGHKQERRSLFPQGCVNKVNYSQNEHLDSDSAWLSHCFTFHL